ncbi:MAG: hypothetical protein LBL96_04325 [Clostridiales bacterium]|jgi:hypothetical protein|nr:hypothetical protein [Clostridiales bacterium]
MKAERLKILEMLEAGIIKADEAVQLLQAIKEPEEDRVFWDEENTKNLQEKVQKFTTHVESISKDVGERLEGVYKDIEPKLRSASRIVVEKTAALVEELGRNLNETLKKFEEQAEKSECECDCCDDAPADNGPSPAEEEEKQE